MATINVPALPRSGRAKADLPALSLYFLLALIAILILPYQVRFTYDQVHDIAAYSPSPQPPFFMKGYPPQIFILQKEGADAGLRMGDQVTSLNGEPIRGVNTLTRIIDNAKPGEILRAGAIRNGQLVQVAIRLQPPKHAERVLGIVVSLMLGMLTPWCSLFLGFYVAAARPRDLLAWIVLGLLTSFSQLVSSDIAGWPDWLRIPSEISHISLRSLWPLFMFLFGYYFPRAPRWDSRFPWIRRVLAAVVLIIAVANTIAAVGMSEDMQQFGLFNAARSRFDVFENVIVFGLIGFGITLLAQKSFSRNLTSDASRRLRLLFAGLMVSLTPVLLLSLFVVFSGQAMDKFPDYVTVPSILILLLFPLTLAYVIVVDRAMDVRVAIRQGLQYAFARTGLAILRIALAVAATWTGYSIAMRLHDNVPGILFLCGLFLAGALVVNVWLKRLGIWIDKRFFREAYNAELVLTELSGQVRNIRETQPLIEMVCERIEKTLHLARISVVLEQDGCFRTCHASGLESNSSHVDFANDSAVIRHLREAQEPSRVYFDDDNSWLYRTSGLDDEQRARLAFLGAELLLPLSTRDQLLGFIAVGQKRSEEPYTKSDIRILSSVASQTGLALENAQLTTAIASEMAQRERLAREVEIAREVQERLFPQKFPAVEGLDYSGMCRTALGVGGDYYDFLSLPGRRFGFAVGDIAGKGISAALLMASLQASLRGGAGHGADDLGQLLADLNQSVYESSSSNRYATFFYGQYTPATREFCYVNAGHNPPILLRKEASEWLLTNLEATGTVVGLLPLATYEQASLQMRRGDYLVIFTDGVSEAMNAGDEEWGEDCLNETARACAESSLPAAETVKRILSAADTFVNGAKQHDDMTIVVLRVT